MKYSYSFVLHAQWLGWNPKRNNTSAVIIVIGWFDFDVYIIYFGIQRRWYKITNLSKFSEKRIISRRHSPLIGAQNGESHQPECVSHFYDILTSYIQFEYATKIYLDISIGTDVKWLRTWRESSIRTCNYCFLSLSCICI